MFNYFNSDSSIFFLFQLLDVFTSSLPPHSVSPSLYSFILWSTVKRLLHRQRINNKILGGDKWIPLRNQNRLGLLLCGICNVLIHHLHPSNYYWTDHVLLDIFFSLSDGWFSAYLPETHHQQCRILWPITLSPR